MAPLVWLITGCSSGFGEQLVRSALARGDKVIATGRNAATRLKHLEDTGAAIIDLDVTLLEADVKTRVDAAVAVYGQIDVLVNNAGVAAFGTFEEYSWHGSNEDFQKVLAVNYFGALAVTRAVLPHLRARRSGTVAFVGSMYGWWSPGGVTPYSSAKHALEAVAAGLRAELAPFGIRVTMFEPGYVLTGLTTPTKLVVPAAEHMLPDAYGAHHDAFAAVGGAMIGNERGDCVKVIERMVDVVRGEGCAAGKKFPERLPLGEDALAAIEQRCRDMLKLMDVWRDVIVSTDRDDYTPNEGIEPVVVVPPMEF